jgi:hypothetical protein
MNWGFLAPYQRPVNPLADAFVGSSPTSPTTGKKHPCFYLVFGSSARTFL